MYALLYRLGAWLAQKLTIAVTIVVLGLAAYALWLFVRDQVDFDTRQSAWATMLSDERDRLATAKAEVERRIAEMQADLEAQKRRIEQSAKIIANLRALESWWDRWFGNREQQIANEQQIARMETLRTGATATISELQRLLTHSTWERQSIEVELRRIEARWQKAVAGESPAKHYLRAAWDRAKWYVALALASYFFGPSLMKLFLYFGVAPLISRGRPVKFVGRQDLMPEVGSSHVSVDAAIWPGEVLRVKERYLQGSDEGLARRTRFVLDWRIPFTSVACGLIELVEMRNTQASGERRVTFSNADDPHIELAVVTIPEGASLVLRPSFLAGAITPLDRPLKIRRRWQLFRWQSWVTLQFRFFEFTGPCRLIVAGSRGVRAECLSEREGVPAPARRTNQEATIGFTPNLEYRPIRAETFWSYYRDMNPLFDDLFSGPGLFLLQETARVDDRRRPGQFWSSVWNGMLKIFGM